MHIAFRSAAVAALVVSGAGCNDHGRPGRTLTPEQSAKVERDNGLHYLESSADCSPSSRSARSSSSIAR